MILNKTIKIWGRIKSRKGTASFVISGGSPLMFTIIGSVLASDAGKYAVFTGVVLKDGLGQSDVQLRSVYVYP